MLPKFVPVQNLPVNTANVLGNVEKMQRYLRGAGKSLFPIIWLESERFYIMNVDKFLVFDASAQGTTIRKSLILYFDAGQGLYASGIIGKDEVFFYYYCSLVYENLSNERQMTEKNERGVMQVAAENFWNLANELSQKASGKVYICKRYSLLRHSFVACGIPTTHNAFQKTLHEKLIDWP